MLINMLLDLFCHTYLTMPSFVMSPDPIASSVVMARDDSLEE